jgi:zinc protease
MTYDIKEAAGFSFATITKQKSETAVLYLSTDIHRAQSAKLRATELLYSDALISGAGKYDRAQFLDALNILGATVTAGISDGVLTMYVKCAASVTGKVLPLVETMLREPHFDKKELTRIKQTVTNLLKESKENTRAIAHEQLRNSLYGTEDRRYSFGEDALIAAIKDITTRDLHKLHAHIMGLAWTCSATSNKDTLARMEKSLKTLKTKLPSTTTEYGIHQQKPPQPTVVLKNVPSKQNIDFAIGAPVPITLHHPDHLPLVFALAVLGIGGFQSRLMSTVREKEGLTYGIFATADTFLNEEQGYWRINTFFAPDKAVQGLTSTFREVKKLYEHGITKTELETFRTNLTTKQILVGDSTAKLLNDLHGYHLQHFSLEEMREHRKRLLLVTQDEVNAAIKYYLNPAHLTISGAGPVAKVSKAIEAFAKSVQ